MSDVQKRIVYKHEQACKQAEYDLEKIIHQAIVAEKDMVYKYLNHPDVPLSYFNKDATRARIWQRVKEQLG